MTNTEKKRTVLQIRLDPKELREAKTLAAETGLSVSELVRKLLGDEAERREGAKVWF